MIDKLVELCLYFGFDGYLLNFEIDLKLEYVSKLKSFITQLSQELKGKNNQYILIW